MSENNPGQNDSNVQNLQDDSRANIKDNLNISDQKDLKNIDQDVKKGQDGILTVTQTEKKPPIKFKEWIQSWVKDYGKKIYFCIYIALLEITFIMYFIVAVYITKYFKPLIFWTLVDIIYSTIILISLKMKQKVLNEEYKIRNLHLKMYQTPDNFLRETYHGQTVIIIQKICLFTGWFQKLFIGYNFTYEAGFAAWILIFDFWLLVTQKTPNPFHFYGGFSRIFTNLQIIVITLVLQITPKHYDIITATIPLQVYSYIVYTFLSICLLIMLCDLCKNDITKKEQLTDKWVPIYHHWLLNFHYIFIPPLLYSIYRWLNKVSGSKIKQNIDEELSENKQLTALILQLQLLVWVIFKWVIIQFKQEIVRYDNFDYENCLDKYLINPMFPYENCKEKQINQRAGSQPIVRRFKQLFQVSQNYYAPSNKVTPEVRNTKTQHEIDKEDSLCKICYTNEANTIINACGHSGMCSVCAKDVQKRMSSCMQCRCKIDKILVIKKVGKDKVEILDVMEVD